MKLSAAMAVLATAVAIGACDAASGSLQAFTLRGGPSQTQGFKLAAQEVVDLTIQNLSDVDFFLVTASEPQLNDGSFDGAFCEKGSGYASAADIPQETAGCEWRGALLASGSGASDAYLVRNRSRDRFYRLFILERVIDDLGEVSVTFELADPESTADPE